MSIESLHNEMLTLSNKIEMLKMSNKNLHKEVLTQSSKIEMLEKYIDFFGSSKIKCLQCGKKNRTCAKVLGDEDYRIKLYRTRVLCANCGADWITEPHEIGSIG